MEQNIHLLIILILIKDIISNKQSIKLKYFPWLPMGNAQNKKTNSITKYWEH